MTNINTTREMRNIVFLYTDNGHLIATFLENFLAFATFFSLLHFWVFELERVLPQYHSFQTEVLWTKVLSILVGTGLLLRPLIFQN
jgi:hypothetical protein